jgi:hypothetical protein
MSPTSPAIQPLNVLIVGAGIAGLSTAIALRRAGHHAEVSLSSFPQRLLRLDCAQNRSNTTQVFEQSSFADEVGAAIQLPPNAMRILVKWGFLRDRARLELCGAVCPVHFTMSCVLTTCTPIFPTSTAIPFLPAGYLLCTNVSKICLTSWIIDTNTETRPLRPAPIPYSHSTKGHFPTSPKSTAVHGTPHTALIYITNSNSLPLKKAPVESPSRLTLHPKLSALYVKMNKSFFQAKNKHKRTDGPKPRQDPETATITLVDGTRHSADLIIAASGIHTPFLSLILPPGQDITPVSTGTSAFRFLIPTSDLLPNDEITPFMKEPGIKIFVGEGSKRLVWYPCRGFVVPSCSCISGWLRRL